MDEVSREGRRSKALRVKLTRFGEAKWLEEREREMGWSRSTAYRHLNPAQMEAAREDTTTRRNVPTVGTSQCGTPAPESLPSGRPATPKKPKIVSEDRIPNFQETIASFYQFSEATKAVPAVTLYKKWKKGEDGKKKIDPDLVAQMLAVKEWIDTLLANFTNHREEN